MHLIYIDDSKDEKLAIFSGIAIPEDQWLACYRLLKEYRHRLKDKFGIYLHKEFHAWEFISGRGKISDTIVTKYQRCTIFKELMTLVSNMPGLRVFNTCVPFKEDERAFEFLLNRINKTMESWGSHAMLICDEGKQTAYTHLMRSMHVYNPIPTRFKNLEDGSYTKNVPLTRFIEDPIFKPSDQSYFVQVADFCAYSLLRRENQLASKNKYGLHEAFDILQPVLVREASRKDKDGIIR